MHRALEKPLFLWFSSYLYDRYFVVKVFGGNSNIFMSPYSIPRGGHLSPLLFLLFVNSAKKDRVHNKLLCFADYMKLLMQINSLDDCLKFQADLNNFYKWSQELCLTLNLDKCHIISFTRKCSVII